MLGWPSSNFPQLLNNQTSEILITLDQSASIAGLLMYGNSVGVLFCSFTFLNPKATICLCLSLQIVGWIVMFYANNILSLFVSRLLVGLGNGFGTTQLKYYIQETCNKDLAEFLCRYLNATVFLGVVIANVIGLFVPFRQFSLYAVAFPVIGFTIFLLTPKYKKESLKCAKLKIATIDVTSKVINVKSEDKYDFLQLFTNSSIRNNVMLIFAIVVIQQYSGGASNIVYSKIIFTETEIFFPELFPIFYAAGVLLFAIISMVIMYKYPVKYYLIISCTVVSLVNFALSLYFYFKSQLLMLNEYFSLLPVVLLLIYTAAHNLGISVVPLILLNTKIPKFAYNHVYKVYVITFSLGAVTSTKLFQYLFTYYDMSMAYVALSFVAFLGLIIGMIFVRNVKKTIIINM